MMQTSVNKLLGRGEKPEAPTMANTVPPAANSNAPGPAKPVVMLREDQEFLPAALEILETPPSPVTMFFIPVLAAFVLVALLWGYFGRLDVIATAQGKIQPPGRAKIVQPVESAKVRTIAVKNGARVREGDVLIELDPSDALADRDALAATHSALAAEIKRRDAAIRSIQPDGSIKDTLPSDWPAEVPELIRQRETKVLAADIAQIRSTLAAIDAQIVQKQREEQRLNETIAAQANLVRTLQERVTMRSTLATTGFGTKSSLIDSRETLQKEEAILAGEKGQVREAAAAIQVLGKDRAQKLKIFLAENTQKKADAERAIDEAEQKLAKAKTRLGHMTLKSPSDGLVQASTVFTIGQVLNAGQEIMRVMPESAVLEVEAYLPNKDFGFVKLGQEVSIKVESFPFTRYGMLGGKVTHIAQDAIPLPDAGQIEANPARPPDQPMFAGAQRTQNLVFPITVTLDQSHFSIDGQRVPISPGMTVTAEIKTGSRRILEYLFSPLVETTSESLRER